MTTLVLHEPSALTLAVNRVARAATRDASIVVPGTAAVVAGG
jgi:hypothetical protein